MQSCSLPLTLLSFPVLHACVCQVRVEGTIEKVSEEESTEYFHSRPHGSQVRVWAGPLAEWAQLSG